MSERKIYEPKELFVKRMRLLLEDEKDLEQFLESRKLKPKKSIRVNTLKISPEKLKKRLIEEYKWKIKEFDGHPEIIRIESDLLPGESGKTVEHILGYYYVQEITSMMPIIALNPTKDDVMLDIAAAPGSKTTQAAAKMENMGTIVANDLTTKRISILSANLDRMGVSNTIMAKHEGVNLTERFKKINMKFDKILLDAPCSGEGNMRVNPRTLLEWSEPMIKSLSRKQKKLAVSALEILKEDGVMIYSTCTHAPEENEEVIQHLIDNFKIKIEEIKLPLKTRPGITEWQGKKFDKDMKKAVRIYPHDNDMEGFFLCKIRKIKE